MTDEVKRKYYNRKWKVTVTGNDGTQWVISDSDLEVPLKCTFRIEKIFYSMYFSCELIIWNLNTQTGNRIIEEHDKVIIEAGYENGPYGKIWEGSVFQAMYERENVTDHKITLWCLDGLGLLDSNITNVTLAAGYDYNSVISAMWKNSHTAIPTGDITQSLDAKKSPRGKVIFQEPSHIIRRIEQDNNAHAFIMDGNLNMTCIDDEYKGDPVEISPEYGLIDTPRQVQHGVNFRHLLNPNIRLSAPPMTVKINQAVIRQMKAQPGSESILSPLDQDGTYKVIGTVYIGDTRGNDWYVDAICVNKIGKVSALFGQYSR